MVECPSWEANSHSATPETTRLLWNHVPNSSPLGTRSEPDESSSHRHVLFPEDPF